MTTTTWAAAAALLLAAACAGSSDAAAPVTSTTSPAAGWCADWLALGPSPDGAAIGVVAETGARLDDPAVAGPAGVIVTALDGGTTEVVDPASPGGRRVWTTAEAMGQLTVFCDGLR